MEEPKGQDKSEGDISMLTQPQTRPISHDRLVVEVKGIYAGLFKVEAKCIEVEKELRGGKNLQHTADHWNVLIELQEQ